MEQAEAIGAQLHRRVELTGVFVNAPLDEVATTADVCRFSMLQLHGDEGPVQPKSLSVSDCLISARYFSGSSK